jgi:hypothetical protein
MSKYNYCALFFSGMLLVGCTPHLIVKSTTEKGEPICKLVRARIFGSKYALGSFDRPKIYLGIKRLDSGILRFWIEFTPHSRKSDPMKKPMIILKLYKGEKITQEYLIQDGLTHEPLDLTSTHPSFSSAEIWPILTNYNVDHKAVSFDVSNEQFANILNSDKIEILIQTQFNPVIMFIQKENFMPLLEFKSQCIVDYKFN